MIYLAGQTDSCWGATMKITRIATMKLGRHEVGADIDPAIGFAFTAFTIEDQEGRYRGLSLGPFALRWVTYADETPAIRLS